MAEEPKTPRKPVQATPPPPRSDLNQPPGKGIVIASAVASPMSSLAAFISAAREYDHAILQCWTRFLGDRGNDWRTRYRAANNAVSDEHSPKLAALRGSAARDAAGVGTLAIIEPLMDDAVGHLEMIAGRQELELRPGDLAVGMGDTGDSIPVLREKLARVLSRLGALVSPESVLLSALGRLSGLDGLAGHFEQIDEMHERVLNAWTAGLNVLGRTDPLGAAQKLGETPPPNVAPEFTAVLRRSIATVRDACDEASEAIRAGGADALDAALAPGTRKHSTAIGVSLEETRSQLICLEPVVSSVSLRAEKTCSKLRELGVFFRQAQFELGVVLERKAVSPAVGGSNIGADSGAGNGAASQISPVKPFGWTKSELVTVGETSDTTFDRIRKAARVKPSPSGGTGQQRRFSEAELRAMVAKAEKATHQGWRKVAAKWHKLLPNAPSTSHQ